MTLTDAVRANPTFTDVPEKTIQMVLLNRGYDGSDEYDASLLQKLELVTADLYLDLATMPDVKEGDLSLKYNKSILLGRARNIYLKYDDAKAEDAKGRKIDLTITKR